MCEEVKECGTTAAKADNDAGRAGREMAGSYSFTASNEAFLGMTSSIKGSKPGYVSSSFWRRPRCTEDLTLDRLLGGILIEISVLVCVLVESQDSKSVV